MMIKLLSFDLFSGHKACNFIVRMLIMIFINKVSLEEEKIIIIKGYCFQAEVETEYSLSPSRYCLSLMMVLVKEIFTHIIALIFQTQQTELYQNLPG